MCSGTIIKLDAQQRVGYVLTASHCFDETAVLRVSVGIELDIPGEPNPNPPTKHAILDLQRSALVDAAIVQFDLDSTPFEVDVQPIPPLSPHSDRVGGGMTAIQAGYGLADGFLSSFRRSVTQAISGISKDTLNYHSVDGKGTCFGDSGGPALVELDGILTVAGIIRSGDRYCEIFDADVRTSKAFSELIVPFIRERSAVGECDTCAAGARAPGGECVDAMTACQADSACGQAQACTTACSDDACYWACLEGLASESVALFQVLDTCQCNSACWLECADTPLCPAPPTCGFDYGDADSCAGCMTTNCCVEATSCFLDPECRACASSGKPETCVNGIAGVTQTFGTCYTAGCGYFCMREEEDTRVATDTAVVNDVAEVSAELEGVAPMNEACGCRLARPAQGRDFGPMLLAFLLGVWGRWSRRRLG